MDESIMQLFDIANRLEPVDGYLGPGSLVEKLRENVSAMEAFRAVFVDIRVEQLDTLEDQPVYGRIIMGAADELGLLPDEPIPSLTDGELAQIPPEKMLEKLTSACIFNDIHAVEVLAAKTDVNRLDHNGQSLLDYAIGNNNIECVRILLAHGADPNLAQDWGDTPLHICAGTTSSKEIFQLLLQAGGDLSIENEGGDTPVDILEQLEREDWLSP